MLLHQCTEEYLPPFTIEKGEGVKEYQVGKEKALFLLAARKCGQEFTRGRRSVGSESVVL